MSIITNNPSLPSQNQVPSNSILDRFNRQTYLGTSFSASTNLITLNNGGVEVPFIYLKNPSTNGKSLFVWKRDVTGFGSTGSFNARTYINPSIASNGTAITPICERPANAANTTGALVFLSPTVSAQAFQVDTITTVADVAGSLNNKYFFAQGLSTTNNALDNFAFWFNVSSGGTNPNLLGYNMQEVDISTGATANAVATALATAMTNAGDFNAPAPGANVVTATMVNAGAVAPAVDSGPSTKTNFTFGGTPGNNRFGTIVDMIAVSQTTGTEYSDTLIILDPGQSMMITMTNAAAGQPGGVTLHYYEI